MATFVGTGASRALEIDLLKGCLQHIEEQRMLQTMLERKGK